MSGEAVSGHPSRSVRLHTPDTYGAVGAEAGRITVPLLSEEETEDRKVK